VNTWASVDEAMKYFGLSTLEELEDLIVEFDLDTLVTDDGRLLGIQGADEMKEALFERFKQQFGHRPDDPAAHEAAVALHHAAQAELKAQRKAKRKEHVDKRVKARKEARDGRTATTAGTGA
jgi:hypothetical protein